MIQVIEQDPQGNMVIWPENKQYTHCLIWIHGLDMSPNDFVDYFTQSKLKDIVKNLKIVLPIAPLRSMTFHKKTVTSWFDIKSYEKSFERDFNEAFCEDTVKNSTIILKQIIEREYELVKRDPKRIIIGGFSQGCAMSLHMAYEIDFIPLCIISISGYLFSISKFDKARQINFLVQHGLADNIRPWTEVQKSYKSFLEVHEVKLYEAVKHQFDTETQINDVFAFLTKHLAQ